MTCTFLPAPLTPMDVRAMVETKRAPVPDGFEYRTAAVMLGHLQLIRRFLEDTSASHGILCEDDVYLRKTIGQDVPAIVDEFDARRLDVLLLGYLWPWKDTYASGDAGARPYRFYEYDEQLWGTQMYMLSRRQASHLVRTYTLDDALARSSTQPFAADWIITKVGRRSRIYPMLAVEEGHVETTHAGQIDFHRRCAEAQYDPDVYV
ncbi:MAG: hypothetical protein ACREF4_00715 [Gammaproteobacteria bacterium]